MIKKDNLPGILVTLSAVVVALYCGIVNENRLYDYIFLIPLTYGLNILWFSFAVKDRKNYGLQIVFYVSQLLMYFRYVLTPFFTVFSASFTSWGWGIDPSYGEMLIAEILMCVELSLIFFVQFLAIRKYSGQKYMKRIQTANVENREERIWILCIYAVIACTLVLFVQPQMLLKEEYFTYSGVQAIKEVPFQGMFVILADTFKKIFIIIILIICKKGYDKRKNYFFVFIAVVALAINMALNSGGTRIHMIFALLIGVYCLNYIFGKIPTAFYVAGGLLCFISFINVSVVKFSYAIVGEAEPIRAVVTVMFGQFQDYFAGPRLVGQMINVKEVYGESIGISTFFNDFFGSVPIVSNYIDQTNRINYFFNMYCNMQNQSLIAPILGIGYCYCPFFPFFFMMIFEYFVIKLDYHVAATNRITYKYLFSYMGFICAMCMGYSTQNLYAQFVSGFLPMYVLFKFNDKVRFVVSQKNRGRS